MSEVLVESPLMLQLKQSQLEPETSLSLKEKFLPFFEQAEAWKAKAESLVIADISQVREMKMAREARLAIKEIRVNVEKTRKALKEDSLRKGKAIDGIANVIKFLIEPIEEHLERQEKFAELQEAKRKEELKSERLALLRQYDFQYEHGFHLDLMDEQMFQNLLAGCKKAHEEKIEAARKEEEERQARFEENLQRLKAEAEEKERIQAENERLKAEAEAREKAIAKERARAEAERKRVIEEMRKDREAADAEAQRVQAEQEALRKKEREEQERKIFAERAERERVEAELRHKKEQEEIAEAHRQAAIEAELSKGDKQKFADLLADLETLKSKYTFKSKRFRTLQASVNDLIEKTIAYAQPKSL